MIWSEESLKQLLGQPESLRLEFKSGQIFDTSKDLAGALSREISGFANTEGGRLILGVAEERQQSVRVASHIDGVSAIDWPPHKLQQLLESNLHPPLIGLRVHSVPLSEFAGARVAFVIEVPQGHTAHQAKDRLYYGRSEYEVKPLHDVDIRLRMNRGSSRQGAVVARLRVIRTAAEVTESLIAQHRSNLESIAQGIGEHPSPFGRHLARAVGADKPHLIDTSTLGLPTLSCNEYEAILLLRNTGAKTIDDFEVHLDVTTSSGFAASMSPGMQPPGGFSSQAGLEKLSALSFRADSSSTPQLQRVKLFPGMEFHFASFYVYAPSGTPFPQGSVRVRWAIFMDDVYPHSDEYDLADAANS
jgi:hypothetical protein